MGFLKRAFGRKPPPDAGARTRDLDAMTIEQLANAGADLQMRRETVHYVYVPTEQAAREANRELALAGRRIEVRPAATGTAWLVLLTQSMMVSPESIAALRTEIEGVSGPLDGEYDGWEAAVTPD